jgi:hypothetical protein
MTHLRHSVLHELHASVPVIEDAGHGDVTLAV